jgi:hypothetical protein
MLCGSLLCAPWLIACDGEDAPLDTEGRVHVVGQALSLSEGEPSAAWMRPDFKSDSAFTYVAAVDSPINPSTGNLVQATNFAFDDKYAYVVYNTAGDELGGALEVVDLSDADHPVLAGSAVYRTAEFAGVRIVGNYAYLVGQMSSGAGLAVVDISDRAAPRKVSTLMLPGRYATSISAEGTTAWVTTGAAGGLVIIDLSVPEEPVVVGETQLDNVTSVVHNYQRTYVLGGTPARIYALANDGTLKPLSDDVAGRALDAPARMAIWNDALYTNAGGVSFRRLPLDGASRFQALATIEGTSNGIDVGGRVAVLAQGELGTFVFDVSRARAATSLGSFSFPDQDGSHNEVRFGALASANYIFLSNGLGGFRIVRTNIALDSDPVACTTRWWEAEDGASWWASPGSASGGSTVGSWEPAAETTDACLVEDFSPSLGNPDCDGAVLKRVRAIGPQPNEGQECKVSCPSGYVIADVHTRYGEASPANTDGRSCMGTTTPDVFEIACDTMSNACAGSSDCSVRYHNEYCGDPWVNCIKNGRTRWACVPE